jgi:hypothetical protein
MKFNTDKVSIKSICDDIDDGELKPHPEWQRKYVWGKIARCDLIDSINREMPIGTIFVWETKDREKLVVDGQQRLTTLKNFCENKFEDENGKKFNQYERKEERKFERYQISVTTIELVDDETEMDILLLFWKLNGGERLTMGELIASHVNLAPKIALARDLFFADEDKDDSWNELRAKWGQYIGVPRRGQRHKRKKEYEIFTPLVVSGLELDLVAITKKFKKLKKKLNGDIDQEKEENLKRVLGKFLEIAENDSTEFMKVNTKSGYGRPSFKKIATVWGSCILDDNDILIQSTKEKYGSLSNMWGLFFDKLADENNEAIKNQWIKMQGKSRTGAEIRSDIKYVINLLAEVAV